MSDTPRTDAAYFKKGATMYDLAGQMKMVERELTAANDMFRKLNIHALNLTDRIKQLEEELMDAKDKHAVLVADVALYEDKGERIKRLEEENNELRAEEARLLNTNGELERRIKRLEEALDTLTCVIGLTPIKGNLAALQEAFDMARAVLKAKEAK